MDIFNAPNFTGVGPDCCRSSPAPVCGWWLVVRGMSGACWAPDSIIVSGTSDEPDAAGRHIPAGPASQTGTSGIFRPHLFRGCSRLLSVGKHHPLPVPRIHPIGYTMSLRYEFFADARDGRIELPPEIAARLRLKGIVRLAVTVSTVAEEEARLAHRGIDTAMIDRVAAVQSLDRDVATVVLGGEGAAASGELAARLLALGKSSGGAAAT